MAVNNVINMLDELERNLDAAEATNNASATSTLSWENVSPQAAAAAHQKYTQAKISGITLDSNMLHQTTLRNYQVKHKLSNLLSQTRFSENLSNFRI